MVRYTPSHYPMHACVISSGEVSWQLKRISSDIHDDCVVEGMKMLDMCGRAVKLKIK